MNSVKMTGAHIIVQSLLNEGVEHIFGYPGGAVIPLYDVLLDSPLNHILTRHEQGAAHAADGYARATGKVGVCLATSGPGATNLVTGLSTACMDSVPMVAITGQVPVPFIGNDSFQEADIYGISIPVTKYNYLVKDVRHLQQVIREAFYIARTGRPGPVLIDIPKDIQTAEASMNPDVPITLPGYISERMEDSDQVSAMIQAINTSRRPVIYAGGGVVNSGASDELRQFIRLSRIPITTTLMGKGIYPENDALSLGMIGMHGTKFANYSVYESDLIIAMGVRFDDRVAGNVSKFAPLAKIVHIDIDAAEIGKRMGVDYPVVGDLKRILTLMNQQVQHRDRSRWLEWVSRIKTEHPLKVPEDGKLKPQYIIRTLSEMNRDDIIISTDVGQHQMWTALYYQSRQPRRFMSSCGAGTMGFGLPASIGAAVGKPDLSVVLITGDGSIQMCIQELATARMYNLPVKIFIFNNGYLGMVRQWQEMFYNKRYSFTNLEYNPDFCKVAEGYDIPSMRVTQSEQVRSAIEKALEIKGPVLIDFCIDREENVLPMIPPGEGQTNFIEEGTP